MALSGFNNITALISFYNESKMMYKMSQRKYKNGSKYSEQLYWEYQSIFLEHDFELQI